MRSITLILMSVVAVVSGSRPLRKEMFFEREIDSVEPAVPFVDPTDGISYRLPNDTFPIHYNIHLKTSIHSGDFGFTGAVEILLEAKVATSSITIHSRQINIRKVDLLTENDETIESDIKETLDAQRDFLIIPLDKELSVENKYKLKIEYDGFLRTDEAGFYRSSYVNEQGETVWLATTQFESTDARHGFPCYDEPSIQATYTISIEHHKDYNAISNMPVDSITSSAVTDYVTTNFQKSLKFQTYLVAFVISNYDFIESASENVKLPQRVFATPTQIRNGDADFALDYGIKVMDALEEYLGVDFLLPKIDQISIKDFAAGAMENYGLVTYHESALLYNSATNTVDRKLRVATVIAHEYAHQWFGNHVSPAWWSYLWLNEGFATLFESYATGLVYPNWKSMQTFVTGTLQSVMISDAGDPRAMTHYVESPLAISELFDNVAYPKSASVLRMLQMVMTEPIFAKGLKKYLEDKEQDFATPEDLYRNLQSAYDEFNPNNELKISEFMTTWEIQPGFPIINVVRNNEVLTLTQERYHQDKAIDDSNSIWSIPINYVVGSNPDFTETTPDTWLIEKSLTIQKADSTKPWTESDWILFNIQETGYYRVNYDMNLWKLLSDELTEGDYAKIHEVNRAQLIDDSFNLARSQRLEYSVPLGIFQYLKQEAEYIPWASANRALNYLRPFLISSSYYHHFETLVTRSIDKFYRQFGIEEKETDDLLDKFSRNIAINWACLMGHELCLLEAARQMDLVSTSQHTIIPDLEAAVYCNGLREASRTTFLGMLDLASKPEHVNKKQVILSSLGCSNNRDYLKSYLELAVDHSNDFTDVDRLQIINSLIVNGGINGIELVLEFLIKTKISTLVHVFAGHLNSIVSNLASRVTNNDQYFKVVGLLTILQSHNLITLQNYNDHFDTTKSRMAWIEKNVPSIETWLSENVILHLPTEEPTSTLAIETTTDKCAINMVSGYCLISMILVTFL